MIARLHCKTIEQRVLFLVDVNSRHKRKAQFTSVDDLFVNLEKDETALQHIL